MDKIGLFTIDGFFEGNFIAIPCPPAYLIVMKNTKINKLEYRSLSVTLNNNYSYETLSFEELYNYIFAWAKLHD